jgi:hypothetical protein
MVIGTKLNQKEQKGGGKANPFISTLNISMVLYKFLACPESPVAAPDISSAEIRDFCTPEILFMSRVISSVVALISSIELAVL